MERLTIKAPSGLIHLADNKEHTTNLAIKKLSDYEDLEEQGLLLRLPCKAETTLFFLKSNEHADRPTKSIIYETNQWKYCVDELGAYFSTYSIPIGFHGNYRHVLGKTVFLAEQEAQSALEKMKEGELNG